MPRKAGSLLKSGFPVDETFYNNPKNDFLSRLYEASYFKIKKEVPEIQKVSQIQAKVKADYWYLNTLLHPDLAKLAIKLNIPYILHLHELEGMYEVVKEEDFKEMLANAHAIVCCGSKVEQRVKQMGYKNTFLLHSFIDTSKIIINESPEKIRAKHNIPSDAFVWLMSGTMSFGKGYDMLPDVLINLPKNHYFVWLGSKKDSGTLHYIKQRAKNEKLNFIDFGSKTSDYYDYLNICDGFAFLSRQDSFPLVMIEAAFLGKPIASFNSGGIKEFVLDGMGSIIDSFNPAELAKEMVKIADGSIKTDANISKARALEFDVNQKAPLWLELIKTLKN